MQLKSGYPFSLIRNGLMYEYPRLEKNIQTDVLILGGGISGALTANHLVQKNIACTVVDSRSIGLGSTCASSSLIQYELDTPLYKLIEMKGREKANRSYMLCKEAIGKLIALAKRTGFTNIQEKKSLYYAAHKKDVRALQKEYAARKEAGLRVRYLSEKELKKETSISAPAAIISEDAAQTDAYMFTHALHQYGLKKGLHIYDRTKVIVIDHKKKGVELETSAGHTIKAKKIVYATGYEAFHYVHIPMAKLQSTYAVISEPMSNPPFWKDDMLIWNTADPYLYLRTTPDNRVMIGGRDEDFYSPKKRDALIKYKTKQLVNDLRKVFPHLNFVPEFSWTGSFASTKDGLPYIGGYRHLPNSYFALGFGGNGITFSLIAAEMISESIKGIKNQDIDIFSFDR